MRHNCNMKGYDLIRNNHHSTAKPGAVWVWKVHGELWGNFVKDIYLESIKEVKVGPIYYPYVREVPVRGKTGLGPSALWGGVVSSFPHRHYLPSISTGSQFAAGWTVRELPTNGSRWVPNRGLQHSRQALKPLCYSLIAIISITSQNSIWDILFNTECIILMNNKLKATY